MKRIAYFDSSHDMPAELIAAAGFLPYKILGDVHAGTDAGDQHLAKFFCPAARSWLTEALTSSGDWEGIIFAHGCDATNRHFDVWKRHVETPFLYWLNAPLKNDDTAKRFFVRELKVLAGALKEQYGTTLSNELLVQSIRESNRVKRLLQKLSGLRSVKDIKNREYFEVIKSVLQPDRDLEEKLTALVEQWESRDSFPSGKHPFLLTGSDSTYVEWPEILEEADIRIVRDDLSTGERMFAAMIPEDMEPFEALATYYLNIPRPATKLGIGSRIDFLLETLDSTPVEGVLSQNLKFCEPYAYDSVEVNKALKEKGHRVFHLEREFTPMIDQQVMNRLSAFVEIL